MTRLLTSLASGESMVVEAALLNGIQLTVLTAVGATATISRVDSKSANAATGHGSDATVAPNTRTTLTIDWPFYFISVAGGACRIAVI